MGKVVEKKKKKKGRPSLLDLQKRRIKEQNENQQHDNSAPKPLQNYNPATPTPLRRSTRRNPAPDASSQEDTPGDDEDLSSGRRRREKELKLVLKLPNSGSENRGGSDLEAEEEDDGAQNQRKRKIAAIGDGSGAAEDEKGEKPTKSASAHQGIQLDSKVSTPLPDKKLLLFILDRLQKKDTYGVFSEPVDPEELPDYHEIIEHPMDFGTVRKKLESGVYSSLEQFEHLLLLSLPHYDWQPFTSMSLQNDVFLICSNAMQYNAPDTVYFRQARAIQELAKKNFENLRQDSDENNEPEPKRRGRPPTKHLKRPPGRPPLDRAASSDATLATGGENNASASYDLRKAQFNIDKSGLSNSLGRPRINDVYVSWLSQNRYERNDEYAGSSSKGSPMKYGKKQTIPDEDRRNTYKQFLPGTPGHEPSVLATFSRERKQLMAVGLHSDHGYARSLARFAASLGPAAWEIASKMIQRSLPNGVKFGPGWVGENDAVPQRWQQLCSGSKTEPSAVWPFSASGGPAAPKAANDDTDSREKVMESSEGQLTEALPPNQDSQPFHGKVKEAVEESSSRAELIEPSTSTGLTMPRPQIVVQQNLIHPGSNGFNSSFSYNNLAAHMGKLIGGGARPPSFSFHSQNSLNPNRRINEKPPNIPPSTNSKKEDTSTLQERPESDQPQQQRPSSVPPDLNIRFNSPSSPSSGRAESAQPDLALQL